MTVAEIWSKLGKGLDDVTAKTLTGELGSANKDPKISASVKKAQTVLDGFRDAGGFNADDFAENELRWLESSEELYDWRKDNPDGDVVKYVRDVIVPKEQSRTVMEIIKGMPQVKMIKWLTDSDSEPEANYETRRAMWLKKAKAANPTFREQQLNEYYDKTYGTQ